MVAPVMLDSHRLPSLGCKGDDAVYKSDSTCATFFNIPEVCTMFAQIISV
jgi:hypothetical protein